MVDGERGQGSTAANTDQAKVERAGGGRGQGSTAAPTSAFGRRGPVSLREEYEVQSLPLCFFEGFSFVHICRMGATSIFPLLKIFSV
jgi:hypothetical protein